MKETKEEIIIRAYEEYEKSLLSRSFSKLSDSELSDDLVQTTFLKTWEYLLTHDDICHMRGFLFHILNNLIIDEYRRKRSVSLDELQDGGFEIAFDETDSLLNIADGKTAMLLIPLLDKKYETVISLRFEAEKTIAEIAETTKQSKNTVVVQIRRGIDKLAVLFRADAKPPAT